MRVVVAAAGPQGKWGNYLGVPSHLAPVDGEPLLTRTVRQALTISGDVHVTVPPEDRRYAKAVVRALAPSQTVEVHVRGLEYPSEYHATRDLWNAEGRTILLLGDTYFTDQAVRLVAGFRERKYQGFGRAGASRFTRCRYGELWAASWYPEHHEQMDAYLEKIRGLRAAKIITRPTGWMLLRAWQGTDLAKHRCDPRWMTTIDDLTDDFDFPQDYDNHPVTRKAMKLMEAGKGHAARNDNLPALLARHKVEPHHVVHVGAHDGEEMPFYQKAKFRTVTLVEPIKAKADQLRQKFPNAHVVHAALGAKRSPSVRLFVMPVTNMTTTVAEGLDSHRSTETVPGLVLADIAQDANVVVIDVQGAELDVLKGANLDQFDMVMVETTTVPDPTMASTYSDVTAYMQQQGFEVAEYWTRDYQWVAKWGRRRNHSSSGEVRDVVYVKSSGSKKGPVADEPAEPPATTEAEHVALDDANQADLETTPEHTEAETQETKPKTKRKAASTTPGE